MSSPLEDFVLALPEYLRPEEAVDSASYASYAYNRRWSPEITPERWARVFPNAAALETRYQKEAASGALQ